MNVSELPPCLVDYEPQEEFSLDGASLVCRARQRSLDRLVTLRLVRMDEFTDSEEADRFFRGAKLAAQIDHPALARVYDIGQGDDWGYVAIGVVEGPTLAEYVQQNALTSLRATEMVIKLASAIAAAHKKGIMHGALDPLCVRIDSSGQPRITGFGSAKMFTQGTMLTCSENILSPYTAPERVECQAVSDPRVDVYGLGAVLYTAITGKPPFAPSSMVELAIAIAEETPIAPGKLKARVPKTLEQICLRALAKKPEDRFGTVSEFANALQVWNASGPTSREANPMGDTRRIQADTTGRFVKAASISFPVAGSASWKTGLAAIVLTMSSIATGIVLLALNRSSDVASAISTTQAGGTQEPNAIHLIDAPLVALNTTLDEPFFERLRGIDQKLSESLSLEAWQLDHRTAVEEFEAAFREFGLDPMHDSPTEIRARIHKKPREIQDQIIHWLVRWEIAASATKSSQVELLQEVLGTVSDEPWTQQFLATRANANSNSLLRLVGALTGEVTGDNRLLIAETLAARNLLTRPESLKFLEMTNNVSGDAFWPNLRLAQLLDVKTREASETEKHTWFVRSFVPLKAASRSRPQIAPLSLRVQHAISAMDQLAKGDPAWAIRLCQDLLQKRAFEDVVLILEPLTQKYQNETSLWRILGEAHFGREEFKPSLDCFLRAVSLSKPPDAVQFASIPDRFHSNGLTPDAVQLLRAIVDKYPMDANSWVNLAHKEWLNGEFEESLKHCDHGIQLEPKLANAYSVRAGVLHSKGRYRESSEAAQRAIDLDPTKSTYYLRLANNARSMNDLEMAKANAQLAIKAAPKDSFAYSSLAGTLAQLGDLEGAHAGLLKSVELNPNNVVLRMSLAKFLAWNKHDLSAAIKVVEDALKETAASSGNRMVIANQYRDFGFPSRAIELLNEVVEREPQNPEPRVHRGMSHFFNGNAELAMSDLEDAFAINPASKIANQYRGKLSTLLGDDESAIELLQKTCDLDPENPTWQERLADSLFRLGRFNDAALAYQRALDLNSSEVSSYSHQERQRDRCRELLAAESQIQEWLAGKEHPESFVTAAEVCLFKLRDYAAAVRFYELAFEADSSLNQSQQSSQSRDNAAIAALRAAAGEGINPIPDSDRSLLRSKAHAWLQAELQALTTELPVLSSNGPQLREKLRAYQAASHYASVRGDALSSLASEERDSWEAFWHTLQQSLVVKSR